MRAVSAHTLESDPYRAGIQLADAVKGIEPEVVFLFPTIPPILPSRLPVSLPS